MGSPNDGESILFEVFDGDYILYSCITDSFKINGKNIPISVADEYGICEIDDVFWTHPHDDHSDGLLEIIDKYNPRHIYLPDNLIEMPEDTTTISSSILKELNKRKGYDGRTKKHCYVDGMSMNKVVKYERIYVDGKELLFSIYCIAPLSGINRKIVIEDKYNKLNAFSIAILVTVGDFALLLTGDLQDEVIKYMKTGIMIDIPTPNILKVPHHGSKTSFDIVSLFIENRNVDVSICTSKKSSGLPRRDGIDFYSEVSDRLYTIKDDGGDLAVWGAEIDVVNASVKEIDVRMFECENSKAS